MIDALYRIPDAYLAHILASYENDRVRSELVRNAPVDDSRLMIPMDVPHIGPNPAFNRLHFAEIEPDPGGATLEEARLSGTTAAMHTILTRFIDPGADAVHSMNPGRRINTDEDTNHKAATPTAAISFDPGGHHNKANNTVTPASIRRHHAVECRSISEFSNRFITGAITANHYHGFNGS